MVVSDPQGDGAFDLDIVEVRTYIDGADWVMHIVYAGSNDFRTYGFLDIDLDNDASTGNKGEAQSYCPADLGAELNVDIPSSVSDNRTQTNTPITVETTDTTATMRIPTSVAGMNPQVSYTMIIGDAGPSDCVTYVVP